MKALYQYITLSVQSQRSWRTHIFMERKNGPPLQSLPPIASHTFHAPFSNEIFSSHCQLHDIGRICARPGRLDHDEPAHQGMPEADLHLLWWTPQKAPSSWWTPSFYMKRMGMFLGLIAALGLRSPVSPSNRAIPRPFMVKC